MLSHAYNDGVADFARYLPLSQRGHDDETSVTSDWRSTIVEVIASAQQLIDRRGDAARGAVSAREFLRDAAIQTPPGVGENSAELLESAASVVRNARRRSVRHLAKAVRGYLRLARDLGATPRLSEATSGAVALYGVLSAPLPRRAVVAGHTLRATDAGWEFGRGPVLEGEAIAIVSFLLGVAEIPPQPPRVGEPADGADGES